MKTIKLYPHVHGTPAKKREAKADYLAKGKTEAEAEAEAMRTFDAIMPDIAEYLANEDIKGFMLALADCGGMQKSGTHRFHPDGTVAEKGQGRPYESRLEQIMWKVAKNTMDTLRTRVDKKRTEKVITAEIMALVSNPTPENLKQIAILQKEIADL